MLRLYSLISQLLVSLLPKKHVYVKCSDRIKIYPATITQIIDDIMFQSAII